MRRMSRSSVHEYAAAVCQRYRSGSRLERKQILDEFVLTTGYHRKSAIRLLAARKEGKGKGAGKKRGRPPQYEAEAVSALRTAWESADWICSRRLQPFMPKLLEALRPHDELVLQAEVEAKLSSMSSSTMDRLMRPYRNAQVRRGLSTTKPGTLLKEMIAVRTFADWDQQQTGFLEVDLVARGEYRGLLPVHLECDRYSNRLDGECRSVG